jgi:hypothetical protein
VNSTGRAPLQRRLELTNWILLAVLLAASLFFRSPRVSLGILCGGLISVVNFHCLYRSLLPLLAGHHRRGRASLLLRYLLRLAVTAALLAWLIAGDRVDVIALLIGLSVIVLNLGLTTLLVLSGKKRLEEA